MRHRFRYALIRLRWLDVNGTLLVDTGSAIAPGVVTADMVKPRPASCAVLEDGESVLE